jgi:hypothetical protein
MAPIQAPRIRIAIVCRTVKRRIQTILIFLDMKDKLSFTQPVGWMGISK